MQNAFPRMSQFCSGMTFSSHIPTAMLLSLSLKLSFLSGEKNNNTDYLPFEENNCPAVAKGNRQCVAGDHPLLTVSVRVPRETEPTGDETSRGRLMYSRELAHALTRGRLMYSRELAHALTEVDKFPYLQGESASWRSRRDQGESASCDSSQKADRLKAQKRAHVSKVGKNQVPV